MGRLLRRSAIAERCGGAVAVIETPTSSGRPETRASDVAQHRDSLTRPVPRAPLERTGLTVLRHRLVFGGQYQLSRAASGPSDAGFGAAPTRRARSLRPGRRVGGEVVGAQAGAATPRCGLGDLGGGSEGRHPGDQAAFRRAELCRRRQTPRSRAVSSRSPCTHSRTGRSAGRRARPDPRGQFELRCRDRVDPPISRIRRHRPRRLGCRRIVIDTDALTHVSEERRRPEELPLDSAEAFEIVLSQG